MKLLDGPNTCDNCRKLVAYTYWVKFPAVDVDQDQNFCRSCTDKFNAWKRGEIKISQLFDRKYFYKKEQE